MPLFDKVSLHVPGRPVLEISALRKDRADLDVVETALDDVKLAETISFSQLVKGGSLITKTRDASSLAPHSLVDVHTEGDSFWGSLTRKDSARQSDHAESANFSPNKCPSTTTSRSAGRTTSSRRRRRFATTPCCARTRTRCRRRHHSRSGRLLALAAFLLGRGSKRKRATGKRDRASCN